MIMAKQFLFHHFPFPYAWTSQPYPYTLWYTIFFWYPVDPRDTKSNVRQRTMIITSARRCVILDLNKTTPRSSIIRAICESVMTLHNSRCLGIGSKANDLHLCRILHPDPSSQLIDMRYRVVLTFSVDSSEKKKPRCNLRSNGPITRPMMSCADNMRKKKISPVCSTGTFGIRPDGENKER